MRPDLRVWVGSKEKKEFDKRLKHDDGQLSSIGILCCFDSIADSIQSVSKFHSCVKFFVSNQPNQS